MQFIEKPAPFLFFTGKGGVGKTSTACAAALKLVAAGHKVLLVSTDPASNLGQVFDQKIGNQITAVDAAEGLSALEIDPQEAAAHYREKILTPYRGVLPDESLRSIEEQLSGACTTEIAAFDEFTGLLTNEELISQWDHILFDTAPTGHTLRLLKLPGAWSGFIADNPEGASCLGPLAGLEKQREGYARAVDVLGDSTLTRLVLVARPRSSSLREAARTAEELHQLGIANQYLVINGCYPQPDQEDALAVALWQKDQQLLDDLPAALKALPQDKIWLRPFNLVGVEALEQLLDEAPSRLPDQKPDPSCHPSLPEFKGLVDELEAKGHGLIMLMGKGGVGKTTLAAAVAVELASRGQDVHLTTSDPAAHLSETLDQDQQLPNLQVSRIDPQVEIQRYSEEVLATKGKNLDAEGLALLKEDLRSPCTEEIAVFQAFSRTLRESNRRFVVMDTAPTGHTLLLLDATGAYHQEIARHMQGKHFVTPMMRLQDPEQTKVLLVTLAETTPVLEAAHLQEDLRRAGIEPWAWLINNSLAAAQPSDPLLLARAAAEWPEINKVQEQLAKRLALVPLSADDPLGTAKLRQLMTIQPSEES